MAGDDAGGGTCAFVGGVAVPVGLQDGEQRVVPAGAGALPDAVPGALPEAVRVVVFDMDGTLVPGDSQTALALRLVLRGILPLRTVLAAQWWLLTTRLGWRSADPETLQRQAVAALRGRPEAEIAALCADIVQRRLIGRLRADGVATVADWRDQGAFVVLASASFEALVAPVAAALGADGFVATRMVAAAGGLASGEIEGRRMSGEAKRDGVTALLDARFARWVLVAAYGDHVSDVPLMELAERPVAVTPTARLRRHARNAGWDVVRWR